MRFLSQDFPAHICHVSPTGRTESPAPSCCVGVFQHTRQGGRGTPSLKPYIFRLITICNLMNFGAFLFVKGVHIPAPPPPPPPHHPASSVLGIFSHKQRLSGFVWERTKVLPGVRFPSLLTSLSASFVLGGVWCFGLVGCVLRYRNGT